MRGCKAGFSLFDLMMAVVLAAVIAGFTMASVQQSLSAYRLDSSARRLASELKNARSLAMTGGSTCLFRIDKARQVFQVFDLSDPSQPPRTEEVLAHGISFGAVPLVEVCFYPRGFVRGGAFELHDEYGASVLIEIHASGRVSRGQITYSDKLEETVG